ncbi:MAG: tRNA (N(6)-L-threonylcarbamoyladenosine(37)-C(2))-methylthiotransferase [Thermoplasmata archaeon]|nr:tRNA (N(6)-L-threonylcarbamoyladenosine(37)-C(2))-methylthiotransferase [Thermoplasmata archaeon]
MIRELALQAGHTEAASAEEADILILGSCIVIDQTERKMWKRLKEMGGGEAVGGKKLIVAGCLPQIYKERLRTLAPNVAIIPPGHMEEVAELFGTAETKAVLSPVVQGSIATLPIATGCRGTCTYCITRLARGELKSRRPEQIIKWTRAAISGGAREIRLTAQDSGAYGMDIGTSLPELLEELMALEGDVWFRVGMMTPNTLSTIVDGMIGFYKGQRAYRFLHMPIQSGSDKILRAMEREYTSEEAESLALEMRRSIPDLTLSTDIIVGFPGEKEEDLEASMEMIERVRPDIVNVTRFSGRPGTKAASAEGQVHGRIAKERSRRLTELRFRISEERKKVWVGKEVEALVLEEGGGRTRNYTPLRLDGEIIVGEMIRARITGYSVLHLEGVPLQR